MPIGYITGNKRPEAEALQRRLAQEWRNPSANDTEPVLIEHFNSRGDGSKYVYVIWQDWQPLTQSERAEIIFDAYAQTHTEDEFLNVTTAIGLTAAEAADKKIYYTLENAA